MGFMKAQKIENPDKPAGFIKSLLRVLIRESRWLKVLIFNRGKIERGNNCYFGKGAEFYIPDFIRFGNNISIGSQLISQANLIIGDNSLISSRVSFIGHDHDLFNDESTAYFSGRLLPATITLEGDNFVGFGSTILGDVTIGKRAIIAAGSLVNKDVPAGAIVGGVPAKIIGKRFDN